MTRKKKSTHQAEDTAPNFLSLYDGRECLGFLLPRGPMGVEAFNANTESLGIYPNQKLAADAISAAASKAGTS
jgi:hypothetical protein